MTLRLYNTLTRKKEVFRPIRRRLARVYCCGPTVYWYAHIGNFRTYVFEDVLRRVLEFDGFKVKHVMNITDVGHLTSDADTGEDKMEVGAMREKRSVWKIADFYTKAFFEDAERLNILQPTIICKATDHISEMIKFIRGLEKKGFTYVIGSGVYFDTSRLKDYGKLIGMNFERLTETLKAGARVPFDSNKRNVTDFALWLFSPKDKRRQMEWDSPWGVGFPGWHIECSAMSVKYLGETLDIHCGGIDHPSIHHTNEIAQSEALTGRKFVNYWLHGAFLISGKKMAKSEGETITVKTVVDNGFDPLAFRYLCLTAHYRSELEFTWDSLRASQNSIFTLREHVRRLSDNLEGKRGRRERVQQFRKGFLEAVNDDLNMPKALAMVWNLVRTKDVLNNREKYELLLEFDKVLALELDREATKGKLPKEIEELVQERQEARKAKNWKKADEIREQMKKLGFILEDTPEGTRWRKAKD